MKSDSTHPFDLHGRVAVVTGGNRGIGLGMARALADAGASVSIWARDEATMAEATADLSARGAKTHSIRCDVSSEEEVVEAARQTIEHFGRVDIGIANAGYGRPADALNLDLDGFRRLLATNLDGVFLVFRELGRHMSQREGGGKLIAVSSISAQSGTPLQPHYAASKGAVEALVRAYAVKLARHDVQVNAIRPGWIVTDATAPAVENADFSNLVVKRIPARRWGTIDDLGGLAVYLASDASRYHTGDVIRVDGGYAIF